VSFKSDRESQKKIREELKEKPGELKRYENKLHQAIFNDNKAERFRKRGNKVKSTNFLNLSESHCEDALEILQDIVDADASKSTGRMSIINSSALGFAVMSKHADIVKMILDQGGSIHEKHGNGHTPLQGAIKFGGSLPGRKVLELPNSHLLRGSI
jgi:hypothetical protein